MGHFRKNTITILMAEQCNLACRYCYVGARGEKSIDVEFAKAGIGDFFKENVPAIRFFGAGEPTLEMPKIKELWEFAKKNANGELFSELQTNGVFNIDTMNWIKDHITMTWISCDGMPEIQNFNRPTQRGNPCAGVVESSIAGLARGKNGVGVRATICNNNVYRQNEMIDYFHSLGVKAVFADHLCMKVYDGNKDFEHVPEMEYAREFLKAKKYAQKYGMFYSNFLTVNFDEPVVVSCRQGLPAPHLTPSGYVSSCDMVSELTGSVLDALIYGKWLPEEGRIEYYEDKIKKIKERKVGNISECATCPIEKHCAGGCTGEAINETGEFFGVKKNLCEATRFLAEELGVNYPKAYQYAHP